MQFKYLGLKHSGQKTLFMVSFPLKVIYENLFKGEKFSHKDWIKLLWADSWNDALITQSLALKAWKGLVKEKKSTSVKADVETGSAVWIAELNHQSLLITINMFLRTGHKDVV